MSVTRLLGVAMGDRFDDALPRLKVHGVTLEQAGGRERDCRVLVGVEWGRLV